MNKHAMHLGVNLLTEIFRDTHTLCHQRQAVLLTVLARPLREHLYVANQTRIHRGRDTAYVSLNTSRKAKRGKRKRRMREEEKEKGGKVRVCKGRSSGRLTREREGEETEIAGRSGRPRGKQTPANWADIF